jgi:hypothetical protein
VGQTETWVGPPRPLVVNAETVALVKLMKARLKRKECTIKNDERSVKMPDAALCVKVTRLEIQWDKRPSLCEAVGLSPYNAVVLGCFVARMGRMGSCGPRLRLSMRGVVAVNEGVCSKRGKVTAQRATAQNCLRFKYKAQMPPYAFCK